MRATGTLILSNESPSKAPFIIFPNCSLTCLRLLDDWTRIDLFSFFFFFSISETWWEAFLLYVIWFTALWLPLTAVLGALIMQVMESQECFVQNKAFVLFLSSLLESPFAFVYYYSLDLLFLLLLLLLLSLSTTLLSRSVSTDLWNGSVWRPDMTLCVRRATVPPLQGGWFLCVGFKNGMWFPRVCVFVMCTCVNVRTCVSSSSLNSVCPLSRSRLAVFWPIAWQ